MTPTNKPKTTVMNRQPTNVASTGAIACQLQKPVARVIAAVDELRIRPAIVINGVQHFELSDVERIAKRIANGSQSVNRPSTMVRP